MKNKDRIIVEEYNTNWAIEFNNLKDVITKHLQKETIEIEHVGSTSIVGLKAKPIIDMDIIIGDESIKDEIINELSKLGYLHVGNLGITGREAFKRQDSKTPYTESNKKWHKHNLYLCTKGSIGLNNHLNFRNYLRSNKDKVVEYGKLKEDLARKHPFDIDAYIDGKTNFIIAILNETGINVSVTNLIANENRKQERDSNNTQ